MKKTISLFFALVLVVSMFAMVSCGKSELSGDISDPRYMTINAKNSAEGDFFMSGTLEVGENEKVAIDPALEEGAIEIQFIGTSGESSSEELPDLEGAEAVYTAYVSGTNSQAVSFGEGSYMVKVTVTEKATGTVEIAVKGSDE